MPEGIADPTVAHQVELVIRRLESISTLPCVLSHLLKAQPSALAEAIESDPALAVKVLSLARQHRPKFPDKSPSIRRAVDRLPAHAVRQALFSVKLYPAFSREEHRVSFRKQLILHSLAVACCAEDIAEFSPQIDPQLAYSAGLFHDIGKLALDEAMPRGFAGIVEKAKAKRASSRTIELKNLGLDHTTIGKRLAAKWNLPKHIELAIWLHHTDASLISQGMPQARIAHVVQLADLLARQCSIGQSGSFDEPSADRIAQALEISPEQLGQIRMHLADKVAQKSKLLGLDSNVTADDYCSTVHAAAARLAQKHSDSLLEIRRLQADLNHFDFLKEFLLTISAADEPIDIAENLAVRWQKFYQTGFVCLYLTPPGDSQFLKAVLVETPSQKKALVLKAPVDVPAIPHPIANTFAILSAADYADWLFDQLSVDFDPEHTKLLPLLSAGKALGAIVFELHYPVEPDQFEQRCKSAASIAGSVLALAFASADSRRFAERFAQLLPPDLQQQGVQQSLVEDIDIDAMSALAEMAGGAAHELNNPLSVIAGRAQFLENSETDPDKKRTLRYIKENAKEISAVIDDLFAFASPSPPQPDWTDSSRILDEAIQLASEITDTEHIDIRIEVAGDIKKVYVDSAQIATALAGVIANAVQSYPDNAGPVNITASADDSGDFVKLTIADLGCGMDSETLKKATHPFFSNQPAGRRRGMGLARAARLIQLNGGSLSITSQLTSGTTVAILLPSK